MIYWVINKVKQAKQIKSFLTETNLIHAEFFKALTENGVYKLIVEVINLQFHAYYLSHIIKALKAVVTPGYCSLFCFEIAAK